jgi:hypothetical protein
MADTAARDCFPTATMDQVKRYIRFAMQLKAAGSIDKFQIVNRRGQPVLQTGKRNGSYTDFQGAIEETEQEEQTARVDNDGPWTTVVKKGKKTASPIKNSTQQQPLAAQPVEGGAKAYPSNWAQQTEEDFPELPSPKRATGAGHHQKADDRQQQQQPTYNSQRRRPSTSAAASDNGSQRQRDSRDGPRSQHSSRGNSRTSSRQTSKERVNARNNDKYRDSVAQEGRSRPLSPPPFRSYFKEQAYNVSEGATALPQRQGQRSDRLTHDQQHRKR